MLPTLDERLIRPCVGCGYCCTESPCGLAIATHIAWKSPCPSLAERHGRKWCQLVLEAEGQQKRDRMKHLAIGAGWCSPLFNSVRDAQIARGDNS